ncbi:MAG: hypothetical protein ABR520_13095 [Mycobacteriales bacterium]|nr:hypothetical protein [Frankia sp.]
MEHVVFYTGRDGAPAFRRVPSLDEAVRLVEHVRNAEGIEDSQVFSLSAVPLSFKPYYRVEVPGGNAQSAGMGQPAGGASAPSAAAAALPFSAPAPSPIEPAIPTPTEPALVGATPDAPAEPAAAGLEAAAPADAAGVPAAGEGADADAAANGRGHGPRGLGFFSR